MEVIRARGASLRRVVLRPAKDVVERLRVIKRDLVVLRDGQVLYEAPRFSQVKTLLQTTV